MVDVAERVSGTGTQAGECDGRAADLAKASGPYAYGAEEAQLLARYNPKVAFGEAMARIAREDELLSIVVSDYGRRLSLDEALAVRPDALVQCGIAEQSQVEVASALANEGFHVFAPAYAPFITARVLDQVRVNLGMMRSPAVLVGISAGLESGMLGASHMAVEDIAHMRSIPNIEVICPADNAELVCVLRQLAADPAPAYVRVTSPDPGVQVHPEGGCFERGRAELLAGDAREAEVGFVVAGSVAHRALESARILEASGVRACVMSMPTVKPLDTDSLDLLRGCRLMASVEEHSVVGGLGGAVAEYLSLTGGFPRLLRIGTPDAYLDADYAERLMERAGLTAEAMAQAVLAVL